jgi:hypothetical protein
MKSFLASSVAPRMPCAHANNFSIVLHIPTNTVLDNVETWNPEGDGTQIPNHDALVDVGLYFDGV